MEINSCTKNRGLPWVRLKEASDLPEENLGQCTGMMQQQLHCTPKRVKGSTEASVGQQNADVAAGFQVLQGASGCGC